MSNLYSAFTQKKPLMCWTHASTVKIEMSSVTVCNCQHNTPDPEGLRAMSSRQSGQQQKMPDGRTCWASSVVRTVGDCWLNADAGKALCFHVVYLYVRASIHVCLCLSVVLFPWYLWCALVDFLQTSISSASWDGDELIWFGVKRSRSLGEGL